MKVISCLISNGVKAKQWYIAFLEKDKKGFFGRFFYGFLYLLSLVYGFAAGSKNFFYDKKIARSYSCAAKVISVGNLCWSGAGKTTLSLWLYDKLSSKFKTAILRRGYGNDEGKMLKDAKVNVFSSPDRSALARKMGGQFDVFILDDGFSHRKLNRDVNIVVMGAREFKRKYRLIPASFFREPLGALRRADIVILNYAKDLINPEQVKERILKVSPRVKIYLSNYEIKRFTDLAGAPVSLELLRGKKIAGFAAVGYPEGFFNGLKSLNLNVAREIAYPDHYELPEAEFDSLQDSLIKEGIRDIVITRKDKYHFPEKKPKINIFIMEVDIKIEDEDGFAQEIEARLA